MLRDEKTTRSTPGNVVLILDDDALHLEMISERIEAEGYRVIPTTTPTEAISKASEVDFVILDFYLPEIDPDDYEANYAAFVLELRTHNPSVEGALLTNERSHKARSMALTTKLPWFYKPDLTRDFKDLLDAIDDATAGLEPVDEFGARYDRKNRRVTVDGVSATLRATEFRVLNMLRQNPHETISFDELCACLQEGPTSTVYALKTQISNIRRGLEDQGVIVEIDSVRSTGYVYRGVHVKEKAAVGT